MATIEPENNNNEGIALMILVLLAMFVFGLLSGCKPSADIAEYTLKSKREQFESKLKLKSKSVLTYNDTLVDKQAVNCLQLHRFTR